MPVYCYVSGVEIRAYCAFCGKECVNFYCKVAYSTHIDVHFKCHGLIHTLAIPKDIEWGGAKIYGIIGEGMSYQLMTEGDVEVFVQSADIGIG